MEAGDRTVVNLGCGAGYMTLYICQNLEKQKSMLFTVCILYLKLRVLRLKKKKTKMSCDRMGSNCLMGTEFPFRVMKIFGNGCTTL